MTLFSVADAEAKLSRPGAPFELGKERSGGWIKFPSGWTVSVQWQGGNYCANYDFEVGRYPAPDSSTAEIAIWRTEPDHRDLQRWVDGDTVQGYLTWGQVQQVLDRCERDEILIDAGEQVADGGWERVA